MLFLFWEIQFPQQFLGIISENINARHCFIVLVEIPFENPRRSFDRLYNWVASKKNHRKLIS